MDKKAVIKQNQASKTDTGSPRVQVAIWTARITHLTEHLKAHHKDNHSRRGLINMVGRRRKLLNYVKRRNTAEYQSIISDLGIRK
jgi:small subunit ribosomal protein S15